MYVEQGSAPTHTWLGLACTVVALASSHRQKLCALGGQTSAPTYEQEDRRPHSIDTLCDHVCLCGAHLLGQFVLRPIARLKRSTQACGRQCAQCFVVMHQPDMSESGLGALFVRALSFSLPLRAGVLRAHLLKRAGDSRRIRGTMPSILGLRPGSQRIVFAEVAGMLGFVAGQAR